MYHWTWELCLGLPGWFMFPGFPLLPRQLLIELGHSHPILPHNMCQPRGTQAPTFCGKMTPWIFHGGLQICCWEWVLHRSAACLTYKPARHRGEGMCPWEGQSPCNWTIRKWCHFLYLGSCWEHLGLSRPRCKGLPGSRPSHATLVGWFLTWVGISTLPGSSPPVYLTYCRCCGLLFTSCRLKGLDSWGPWAFKSPADGQLG